MRLNENKHANLKAIINGERLCVSVPEAAIMLGVSRNFAYEMVRQKQLPVIHLGKRLLIPKIALEKMLEQGVQL